MKLSSHSKLSKAAIFETMPIPKAVARLAIPTIISSLVMVLYNLADTFFVGYLNDPVQTSAVSLAAPVLLAFNAVNNLFGTGASSLVSRALGSKDYLTVKKSSAFGFYGAIAGGIAFSVMTVLFQDGLLDILGADSANAQATREYLFWTVICGAVPSILGVVTNFLLRAEGVSVASSAGVIGGCLLNIVLDPVFILPWGLDMGAAGAGCATFLSNSLSCLYFGYYILRHRGALYISANPKYARPTRSIVSEVFQVGLPACVQNLLNVCGMTVLNNLTSAYGAEAVSAMGIAHKVALVPLYFSMGGGQGVMPLVGYNYASGNTGRMKQAIGFSVRIFLVSMVIAAALIFLLSENIIACFMSNALIVEYGSGFLRGFALAVPFLSLDFLMVAVFQACGKGKLTLLFALLRKVVLEIPAVILLNRLFGMYGLAYGQLVAEFVLSIVSVTLLKKTLLDPLSADSSVRTPGV